MIIFEAMGTKMRIRHLQDIKVSYCHDLAGLRIRTSRALPDSTDYIQIINTTPIVAIYGNNYEVTFVTKDAWNYSVLLTSLREYKKIYKIVEEIFLNNVEVSDFYCFISGKKYDKSNINKVKFSKMRDKLYKFSDKLLHRV